jgi:alginate O-acetyltransferase complex protein AlgI
MVFSSLIFLFLFLPATLTTYFLLGARARNLVLLLASLLFYAWGEGGYVLVMLISIALNFAVGLALSRCPRRRPQQYILAAGIAANLGILIFYKYAGFIVENINVVANALHLPLLVLNAVHLPIGISFFTFQAISYIVDVYRKTSDAQKNPLHLGLYIALFPQLIAGPIIRYHDVAQQLLQRQHTTADFANGVERFIIGLGKKVLIANPMGNMADEIFQIAPQYLSASDAWLGAVCYALQIYYDFSGYSDMAIGLGRMFGFHFLENFNFPYISQSLREFWQRWHISLSNWFRDYLYIPLGGNRQGNVNTFRNLLVVFFLCGLWHGASWNFVVWGLFHGLFLILERWQLETLLLKMPRIVRHAYVILLLLISWVFFRSDNLTNALQYLGAMFGVGNLPVVHPWVLNKQDVFTYVILTAGIIFSLPVSIVIKNTGDLLVSTARRHKAMLNGIYAAKAALLSMMLILSVLDLASGAYNPFIYFRF